MRAVRRRIVKRCSGYVGRELVCSMVRGEARKRMISVEIAPAERGELTKAYSGRKSAAENAVSATTDTAAAALDSPQADLLPEL